MIITFYSYKGGTGRTMALANIAAVLAGRGRRVLAVDFDLEAPGLWRYFSGFRDGLDQQAGLIDLLTAAAAAPDAVDTDWHDYVTRVPVGSAELSLMTSGQLDESYSSRVLNFDWAKFFEHSQGGEFFEQLRRQWRQEYEFTFIDSRTGITDSGGICTIMLPDLIVPVFVSNLQSLEGAVEVIARAQTRRKTLGYDRPPAAVLPILSRFDSRTEYESAQDWLERSADRVKSFYSDWLPSNLTPHRALERTKLPHVAYFSFGEKLPALTEGVSDPESLGYAMNAVAQLIEQELGNAELIIGSNSESVLEEPAPAAQFDITSLSTSKHDLRPLQRTHEPHSKELVFYDREQELENVLRGLTNPSGPHFWLVLGPPQLGKTWFLDRISKDLAADNWQISRIDLRDHGPAVHTDPDALLSLMFGRGFSAIDEETLREIAIEIINSGRPHLYVLDSAELLNAQTAAKLREYLSPIYQRVLRRGRVSPRLAVIVSSRQDDGWRGLSPDPRLHPLSLTEFNQTVIQQALVDLADRTEGNFGQDDYWRFAHLTEGLTEGLPTLLALCLQWIASQQWTDLDRMAEPETFRHVAAPYVESELLTSGGLFPGVAERSDDQLLAVRSAYRLLAPYRLFTQSHLRHHVARDPDLTDVMARLGWSSSDLWQAIVSTALLQRPVTEAWQRIHPAVRRLLYRYFYQSEDGSWESGVEAHHEARTFLRTWTEEQSGPEQVVGVIECLWHEINTYLPDLSVQMAVQLKASARQLSEDLRPSPALTLEELREYAAQLMRGDHELQRAIRSIDSLFEQLVEIVQRP